MQTSSQGWFTPEWGCVMVISIGSVGYFDYQGHNSLNVGPIFSKFLCINILKGQIQNTKSISVNSIQTVSW